MLTIELRSELFQMYKSINAIDHRLNGPTIATWIRKGVKRKVAFVVHGKFHNAKGWAHRLFFSSGQLSYESYILNDRYHNKDGPSIITYRSDGTKVAESYYIDGEEVGSYKGKPLDISVKV